MRPRILAVALAIASSLCAGQQPFLSTHQWTALRDEATGSAPYENLRYLTTLHRVPATPEFDQAAQSILQRAREYGLQEAHTEQFPADGKTQYGLMRAYLGWRVRAGRLWEAHPRHGLMGDWSSDPIRLADYSHTADIEASLVDVGDGGHEADYSGKEVSGKIVLADGVLARVQELAVMKHGAAGIVSDMPNQTTAWSGMDRSLVRWGHLEARLDKGFAFMVSREEAEALRARMHAGEAIVLNAHVEAEVGPGNWTVVSAVVPGSDANAGEVVFSCHLDHERPGANDNGSGCVTILEAGRIIARLVASNVIPRPRRTMRFIWGPEVEGTMAYLARHPEIRQRLVANIHMDMVGGDPFKNKSVFHVTATPWSLPSFVTDVGTVMMETIQQGATDYAESGAHPEAAVVESRAVGAGTRNEFPADVTPYSSGSDHDDYDSSTIAVPSLYLRDWPDIYIHTDHDSLQQIDATKLRRVALLGAAAGYVFANMDGERAAQALPFLLAQSEKRLAGVAERARQMLDDKDVAAEQSWYEARNLLRQTQAKESETLRSLAKFAGTGFSTSSEERTLAAQADTIGKAIDEWAKKRGGTGQTPQAPWAKDAAAQRVPVRVGDFGPLTYQNDNVLQARLGQERYEKIKLLNSESTHLLNTQDQGELYAYEIVNFVDGRRSVGEIRDATAAEYGPISADVVADYLQACVEAGVMKWK